MGNQSEVRNKKENKWNNPCINTSILEHNPNWKSLNLIQHSRTSSTKRENIEQSQEDFLSTDGFWEILRNDIMQEILWLGQAFILCIFGVLILYSIPKIHVSLPIAYKVFDSCCKWLCFKFESPIQLTIRNIRSWKYKINQIMNNNSKNKSKEELWPGIEHTR